MAEATDLSPAAVEAVARRVVELLSVDLPSTSATRPLTVAEVAERFGRSREWVRDHRTELGVLALDGKRPRLLFDPAKVERFARQIDSVHAAPDSKSAHRRRRARANRKLLPIGGGSKEANLKGEGPCHSET